MHRHYFKIWRMISLISGKMLKDALISAALTLSDMKKQVDELNVYPVPDGDTGTNMSLTLTNAMNALQNLDDGAAVSEVASVAASAMLRGARGNSGVITSLLFRGFSKGLADKKEAGCYEARRGHYPHCCKSQRRKGKGILLYHKRPSGTVVGRVCCRKGCPG